MAAGTVTTTETVHATVKKVAFAWTAGTAGDAGTAAATTVNAYDGKIIGLATIPSGGGTAPTDDYDVALTDADGHDVLLGAGANRDTANTEFVAETSLGAVAGSRLSLAITNAGSAKAGTVIVYIR